MKTKLATILALGLFFGLCTASSFAGNGHGSRLVTNDQKPRGMSYSQWAAEWWTWAVTAPEENHPLINDDQTGDGNYCEVGQPGYRNVFFLGGTFFGVGPDPVVRTCKVKTGTALFFPIVNRAYFAFIEDEETEEEARSYTNCDAEPELFLQIDDTVVDLSPPELFEESVVFEVVVPEGSPFDVWFGLEGQVLYPSVDEGHYVFLRPAWQPGEYTIIFTGDDGCGNTQAVTYNLIVQPGKSRNRD